MPRFRLTIRGEGIEVRGYTTIEGLAAMTAPPGEQPYIVMASVAEDDYDPFRLIAPDTLERESAERELHHFEVEQENERLVALVTDIEGIVTETSKNSDDMVNEILARLGRS